MKILLIIPDKKGFSTEGLQSLGIGMIAAVLKKAGHDVAIKDLTVQASGDDDFAGYLADLQPEMVGFTVVTPTACRVYEELIPLVRRYSSACRIVLGGPHPTALADEALQYADIVVRGEGEETIVELCSNIDCVDTVAGISYRTAAAIVHNPPREFIQDLNQLPLPARELFPPLSVYGGLPSVRGKVVGNISTSRGCYGRCKFCYNAIFGRKSRYRSAENILEEWEQLVRNHGAEVITISDDHFTSNPKRIALICSELERRGLHKTPWTCSNGIRVETATLDMLRQMKSAGCRAVAFGIESGSQQVLDLMDKRITLDKIRTAVANARKAGIPTITGFFMLGTPWDTLESMRETIEFSKSLPLDYAQFAIATPYPGTEMHDMVKDCMTNVPYSLYGAHEGTLYFQHKSLSDQQILDSFRDAYRSFYLRPGMAIRHLRRIIATPSTLSAYLGGLKTFIIGKRG